MKQLHIYPTSRALRNINQQFKQMNGFLPTLMRMDEFENRVIVLESKALVDPMERILLLREAASFETFEKLNLDLDLVRFFTKSDAIFKFFEELSAEYVDFETLAAADAYVEFEQHLKILETLLQNYYFLLESKALTDKVFIPKSYQINRGFIQNFDRIEIYLEGYLSRFELELIEKAAQHTQTIVHFFTSGFNLKMQERFKAYGIFVSNYSQVSIDFSAKAILSSVPVSAQIATEVIATEERYEQIAHAFVQIEQMVRSGIAPEKIALILPDEGLKESLVLYDKYNNLNFAMGYDYSKSKAYKKLSALFVYWQNFEPLQQQLLERYGLEIEQIDSIDTRVNINIDHFFVQMDKIGLIDFSLVGKEGKEKFRDEFQKVYERYLHLRKLFSPYFLNVKEWLFLWLQTLDSLTIDDVRGGKITVMGVLETRGVCFEGVVILDFNEGIVPATSSKDQFLNSTVRTYAGLPTKNDREALQKQYYKRLLEQAKRSVIFYSTSDNRLPSKFLYELGLNDGCCAIGQFDILYHEKSQIVELKDPVVEMFDATCFIWSASKLKIYLECKRRFYYRYIQKIKAKKEEEWNEGSFLHSLFERLYAKNDTFESSIQMRQEVYRFLDEMLSGEDAKSIYRKLLYREKLKGFVSSQIAHFKEGWRVVERELKIEGEIGGLNFTGRVDRLDQNDTHTLVLDYKSGSIQEANRVKNLEKLTDFQMSIYHHLLSPKYTNLSLAFVKLFEEGKMEAVTALEEKNELLGEHLITLKQTKSFIAQKCEDLQKCKYCEFALMCERGEYL